MSRFGLSVVGAIGSILAVTFGPAIAQGVWPDPSRTPGTLNPDVSQANIGETICVRGWTRSVRPPRRYTSALKRLQLREMGGPDRSVRDYEEDHLVPLSLGGAPSDPHNLWPQPFFSADGWGADRKDELEGVLRGLVCSGRVPLIEAQEAIASDWIEAYRRYVLPGGKAAAAPDVGPEGRSEP